MKHLKHVLATVVTLFMAFALAVPAFAAGNHSISLNSDDTHTYTVYQVLVGTLSEEGSLELGNPAWGADAKLDEGSTTLVNGKTAQQWIDSIKDLTGEALAEEVAKVVDITADGRGNIDNTAPMTGLDTGYYVLVDKTTLTGDHQNDTKALHVVQVVNNIDGLTIKWGTTEDEKTIESDTLGKDQGTNPINDDTDNVSVGDTVNYKIDATVPANAALYDYFFFIINDTLSEGLTFNKDIALYDGETLIPASEYTVKIKGTGEGEVANLEHTFEVALKDAKKYAGKTITVKYSAELNDKALIGEDPNKNTSTVTFSNDPNHDYEGDNDEDNPGFPADTTDVPLGETPETETETYTTGIEIQKVDQDGNALTGATFEISGTTTKKVLKVVETFTADEAGEYYKLKNGTYTKQAPTTDDYMEKTPGATEGYVIENGYTGEGAITIDEVTYRPYKPADDAGKDVYVLHHGNEDLYDHPETKYKKGESKTIIDATSTHKAEVAVDENGLVRFDGLGEGTYVIKETVTPAGYNTLPDLTVVVDFDDTNTPKWSFSGGEGAYDLDEGIYKITIKNNKGTELPETGGMGTTILYIVGGCMVAAGVVMFLAKRRMANVAE